MPTLNGTFEFWGVVVRPGATVKCDPGESYCHVSQIALQDSKGNEDVRVFVKVDGKKFPIGTLSVDKYPQYTISLVFKKEFELLHTSKTSTISALGYKFRHYKGKYDSETSSEEDDESDEEVPQAIPLYPNADDDKSKESKCGVEKPAATESSKPKVSLEEAKDPNKHKAHVDGTDNDESDEDVDSEDGESGDDENSSDEDDGESSNEEDDEDSPKSTKRKNRPAETPLKTPPGKKARITTPSMDRKPVNDDAKKSGHVHVATPYPSSKQVKTARSIISSTTIDVSDDESDEEVPQAIPLYPNADDDKSKESKCGVEKPAATESSKPKVSLEEAKDPDKHKAHVDGTDNDESDEDVDSEDGESGDDENSSDEDDGESSSEEDDEDPPRFLELLEALFGDDNRNTGYFKTAGGFREERSPLGVLHSPNHSGPSNYHSGAKRAFNDQDVANSTKPDAKRSCEIGEYMAQLSQSIVARTNSKEREKQSELADIDEAVAIMESDGVETGSELQYEALEIFRCRVNRHFYKNILDTPKARIDWLQWQMQIRRKEKKSE